jgi:hypothetical protein
VRELDRLKKEWKAGRRHAAYLALGYCRRAKRAIPKWVLDAVEIDGHEAAVKKFKNEMESRNYRQRVQDRSVHATVLDFRAQGMTWEKAYEKAAIVAGTFDGTELNAETAKNAYIRVRRLEKARKLV